jgi:hypothetical protein
VSFLFSAALEFLRGRGETETCSRRSRRPGLPSGGTDALWCWPNNGGEMIEKESKQRCLALLVPWKFDQQVTDNSPHIAGRVRILEVSTEQSLTLKN